MAEEGERMKTGTASVFLTLLFLACVTVTAVPARATPGILEVGKTGYPFATISAAVAVASPGDTILVHPGTYTENVVINTDGLTIRSSGPKCGSWRRRAYVTIVDGDGSTVFTIDANGITIDGFTIRNGKYGILFMHYDNKFTQNIIHNNVAGIVMDYGDLPGSGARVQIEKNTIYENNGAGISAWFPGATDSNIAGNNIHDNAGSGIHFTGCSRNTISYNRIHNNGGNGINLLESTDNTMVFNSIVGNGLSGVKIRDSSECNNLIFNTVIDNDEHGLYIDDGAYSEILGNRVINNGGDGIHIAEAYEASQSYIQILGNRVINNGGDGIHIGGVTVIDDITYGDASYIQVLRNIVINNGADGIHIGIAAYENRVEYNTALNNNGYDLYDEGTETILNNNLYGTSYP